MMLAEDVVVMLRMLADDRRPWVAAYCVDEILLAQ